jgi:hypothetical protein
MLRRSQLRKARDFRCTRKAAGELPKESASLHSDPDYRMPLGASKNPKEFIRGKIFSRDRLLCEQGEKKYLGSEWFGMVRNGSEWFGMVRNGSEWSG